MSRNLIIGYLSVRKDITFYLQYKCRQTLLIAENIYNKSIVLLQFELISNVPRRLLSDRK